MIKIFMLLAGMEVIATAVFAILSVPDSSMEPRPAVADTIATLPFPPPVPPSPLSPKKRPAPLIESEPEAVRLLHLLKDKEPEAYEILVALAEDTSAGTKSLREAQQESARTLQQIFTRYLPYADDSTLIDVAREFITLGTTLQTLSPETCRRYVLGEKMTEILQVTPLVPRFLIENNVRVLNRVMETADLKRPIPTTGEISPLFDALLTPTVDLSAGDIALVTDPGNPYAEATEVCHAFLHFYRAILQRPPPDAARLLRYRFFYSVRVQDDERPPFHDLRLSTDKTKIVLSGYIGPGTARQFSEMLQNNPTVSDIYTNGDLGGLVGEARAMRDEIQRRGLTTRVTKECVSACTIVFLGGKNRFLYPGGRLGFHRYDLPGFPPLQGQHEQRDLLHSGISFGFAAKVSATPSDDVWYPDPAELSSSGVITTRNPPPHR